MQKEFDTLVFLGRFSPLHFGHCAVIDTALQKAKEVIIVIGSSFAARSLRNPFTFEERKRIIKSVYPQDNVKVVGVSDYPYSDNKWVSTVQSLVRRTMYMVLSTPEQYKIGLIGHSKDASSYYLNIFPAWGSVEVKNFKNIDATAIRKVLFGADRDLDLIREYMPVNARITMNEIIEFNPREWKLLLEDFKVVQQYHKSWSNAPYTPMFVTTDAMLVQNGRILLVERGESPFKGKLALPGGHLEKDLSLETNMIKELKEETRIKVPEKVLRGSISEIKVFDEPNRDPRGRYITHAFYINLGFPDTGFPKVKGNSDAKRAEWFDLGSLKQEDFAFDHWHIIQYFLKG